MDVWFADIRGKFAGGIIFSMAITLNYEPSMAMRPLVGRILESARGAGNEELVARCLLAARLKVGLAQFEGTGSFRINDFVFYVAVAPDGALYERCRESIKSGYCVYLLVPERVLDEVRQSVDLMVPGNVEVDSVESFVAMGLVFSAFSHQGREDALRQFLDGYNGLMSGLDGRFVIEVARVG